ncbi:MAG: hypothetical protein ACI4XE_03775 [Acutalibacteraceae bacterium]
MKTYAEKNWGDCSKAVAYSLNFVQLCYAYESDCYADYFELCSSCGHEIRQIKPYEYPKSGFSKKDYFLLDTYEYGVSDKLKADMIAFGVPSEIFKPVYTRKHDIILGWYLAPETTLPEVYKLNCMSKNVICRDCGYTLYEYDESACTNEVYGGLGYPFYIDEKALSALDSIAKTTEYGNRDVLISLDLYNFLIEKYPRLECRPVFLGNIRNDPEFLRVKLR